MDIRESISRKVLLISLWSNIILALGKIIVGLYGNSNAVFADGIHSGTDVFTSIIALFIIKISNKPADEDHPYGHGKAEVMSSGIVGVLLVLISIYLGYEGIAGLIRPLESPKMVTLYAALFSFVFKLFLYRYSLKMANKYNSKAVEAIAIDHKADIAASLTAAIGVIFFQMGLHKHIHPLLYSDKVASIIVAALILKMAAGIVVESIDILLERNIDGEILENLANLISQFEEVKRIDRIRAREHGHYIMVDVRIAIDPNRTIKEGHDLAREIKFTLMKKYNNIEEVLIHFNPYFQERE